MEDLYILQIFVVCVIVLVSIEIYLHFSKKKKYHLRTASDQSIDVGLIFEWYFLRVAELRKNNSPFIETLNSILHQKNPDTKCTVNRIGINNKCSWNVTSYRQTPSNWIDLSLNVSYPEIEMDLDLADTKKNDSCIKLFLCIYELNMLVNVRVEAPKKSRTWTNTGDQTDRLILTFSTGGDLVIGSIVPTKLFCVDASSYKQLQRMIKDALGQIVYEAVFDLATCRALSLTKLPDNKQVEAVGSNNLIHDGAECDPGKTDKPPADEEQEIKQALCAEPPLGYLPKLQPTPIRYRKGHVTSEFVIAPRELKLTESPPINIRFREATPVLPRPCPPLEIDYAPVRPSESRKLTAPTPEINARISKCLDEVTIPVVRVSTPTIEVDDFMASPLERPSWQLDVGMGEMPLTGRASISMQQQRAFSSFTGLRQPDQFYQPAPLGQPTQETISTRPNDLSLPKKEYCRLNSMLPNESIGNNPGTETPRKRRDRSASGNRNCFSSAVRPKCSRGDNDEDADDDTEYKRDAWHHNGHVNPSAKNSRMMSDYARRQELKIPMDDPEVRFDRFGNLVRSRSHSRSHTTTSGSKVRSLSSRTASSSPKRNR